MADIDSEKERRLVADLLEGDESAFCELYALYKDRLMWFSLKFLKSRDMAEDVFQDAFASIWQNRRFLNECTFWPVCVYDREKSDLKPVGGTGS